MSLGIYEVTLRHDAGSARIRVTAASEQSAIHIATDIEYAPLRAVKSVRLVRDLGFDVPVRTVRAHVYGHPFTHLVSATALTDGSQLGMCGHVFRSYRDAVDAGHPVGNYVPLFVSLSDGHARGVDCESCIVRHMRGAR